MTDRWIGLPLCAAVLALAACGGGGQAPPDRELAAIDCIGRPVIDVETGATINGAEDLAVVDAGRLLLAAYDRRAVARALARGMRPPEGGVYLLRGTGLKSAGAPLRLLPVASPVALRPHGIAVWRQEGRIRLAVIDRHHAAGEPGVRIWAFTLLDDPPRLADARLLADGPAWCAANDLVAEPEGGRLFVSLDHAACTGPRRLWEDLRAAASGRIVALPLDPPRPLAAPAEVVAAGLRWPNGLALVAGPGGAPVLAVAETRGYRLTMLPLASTASAPRRIRLPAAPDNLTIAPDPGGGAGADLIVAAHPSLLALAFFRDHLFGVRRVKSLILRVPADGRAGRLYAGSGALLSAATAAAVWGGLLVATSAWDHRMLICRLTAAAGHGEHRA